MTLIKFDALITEPIKSRIFVVYFKMQVNILPTRVQTSIMFFSSNSNVALQNDDSGVHVLSFTKYLIIRNQNLYMTINFHVQILISNYQKFCKEQCCWLSLQAFVY